ncbi:hypothetical protein ATL39_1636 [Sinobaca qinghaiensis]|uniref:Amidase n=1 Tax=Sinobaca qinghaiensis TaxID=342944 RepID=A0A419V4C7_9BACL|nr:amidase [Sinobaca qinghaiensis]RKD73344.1 hypothetical protein ATL39_1636 [Sinobaca qinghaiensis]
MKRFFSILTILLAVIIVAITPQQHVNANGDYLSTWLWDTNRMLSEPDRILTFLESKEAEAVYLQIDRNIPSSSYRSFIQRAGERGIAVHALDGASDWGERYSGKTPPPVFSWLNTYQNSAAPSEKFAAVHLDVEPYLHSSWNTDYKKSVFNYQKLMINSTKAANDMGLPLFADMPFWFDERTYNNKIGKGNLAEWIIKQADGVNIMAYRDKADGPNGITALVSNEMNWGNVYATPVTIGVETMNLGSSESFTTFYEEGETYMQAELEKVRSAYSGYRSFNGFSMHHTYSWIDMKP